MKQLFDAIKAGDVSQVTALLDQDASLANAADEKGQTALVTAKYFRQEPMAVLLEARGATLDIFSAALMGRTEVLEELISGNRSLVSMFSGDGWTALHLAAFFGQQEAVRALLNKGAPVNARSINTMANTPLHAAAAGKSKAIAQLLLEHGANANARQHGGFVPLHAAAQIGDIEMARALLAAGADVSARADNHQRPIDLAMTKAQQSMVEFLEANGASL
jgi:ankyrin repeat protein